MLQRQRERINRSRLAPETTLLAGIGLWLCGIPHPGVLTAIAFVFGIAQVGPAPVLLPAVAWLYWTGSTGWGTVLLVWTIVTGGIDNVIRPILISKGTDLSLLLIFFGVVGGLLAFGVIGLFVGPVVLAVAQALLRSWMDDADENGAQADHTAA